MRELTCKKRLYEQFVSDKGATCSRPTLLTASSTCCRYLGLAFQVQGSCIQFPGSRFRVPDSGISVPGSGFQVQGFGVWVPGAGL